MGDDGLSAARDANTRALARFIRETRPASLPREVDRAVRRAVLDAIGCGLGGVSTVLHERAVAATRAQGSQGPVPCIGGTATLPAGEAALVNAIAINALDYDDTYEDRGNPIGHPGSSTVGALLAMLWTTPAARLDELLTTVAVGYESAIRVALAVQPTQVRRDLVWGLGLHQVFGSAAVTARQLGLDEAGTIECLGLAGVHTSVPSVWTAAGWLKDAVGWPTMTGVLAGHLAAAGFRGPTRILDGRRSYHATVSSDRYRPELLHDGLGTEWRMASLSLKPYPACRWIHPVLEALRAMWGSAGEDDPDALEVLEVSGFWELERLFLRYRPTDLIDAQFSLPYTCAQVILGVPAGPAWFTDEQLGDPTVLALADRIRVTTDPEVEADRQHDQTALQARITLRFRDGRTVEAAARSAHGGPDDPLSDEEVAAKARLLAVPVIGNDMADRLVDGLLDGPPDMPARPLLEGLLRPPGADARS